MKIIEDLYLGDGVYASFDGYHITLDLRATEFMRFKEDIMEAIDKANKEKEDAQAI